MKLCGQLSGRREERVVGGSRHHAGPEGQEGIHQQRMRPPGEAYQRCAKGRHAPGQQRRQQGLQ